ncbi:uncharacterized protein [Dermacentor andersoni]|uniref:uncharacterized protein n=1 Tax=Dermacentor andersoni TaxID=34620 RepID=UPI0021557BB9|nr:uncharacterized protein LOC126545784 [Dermacentor andersoni]XP_050049740.1 uncharacterized protein LOC126545784 [Dermacentor andersoni]XP_050049741.1 uncharacterized protein LOC126545784 [Dermacentor andersoni]XP_054917286.1 uncharacterized protein LOC126545784 [Dermacentor andersoni]
MERSTTGVVNSPQPAAGDRRSAMPPIAHCVAFCGAFGLVFAVSGAVLLSSGLPYRRLQLRIISACMLAMGVVLLAAAIVLIFAWRNRHHIGAVQRARHRRQRHAALVIRVPTVSGTYVYSSTPAGAAAGAAPLSPPPPAYEDLLPPPPSYESVMMLKRLEKAAKVAHQLAESARRGSAPAAADV